VIRLAVRVRGEHAELVLAELLELVPAGVEEVHGTPGTPAEGTVEYAVYGAPGELPELPDVRAAVGGALVEVSTTEIPDDWHERWRQFHKPVLIQAPAPSGGHLAVPSLRVRPPWEAPEPESERGRGAGVNEIVIDPGQAFGTGGHATTRLCLELLLQIAAEDPARGPVLDVGTGSGVLAIAAATLGFEPVLGLDHERESVAAAQANAAVNDVHLEVRRFDLRSQELAWPRAQPGGPEATIVLANLLRPLLIELARGLSHTPAQLIAGGLLRSEVDQVVDAFALATGMRERQRREQGEWAAVWLTPA
jgi:ribosomal protein L11 methyltransferase